MSGGSAESKKQILVVGDWYVDAHWVVGHHQSESASRPGDNHYLAVHGIEDSVRTLCGAGQVASILAGTPQDDYVVNGLGSWADGDDEHIKALVFGLNQGDNPCRLQSKINTGSVGSKPGIFANLHDGDTTVGTKRVIRLYREESDAEYRLTDRIDFETPMSTLEETDITSALKKLPETVHYVLVKDHGAQGIVTADMIFKINCAYPKAHWYIATKRWKPEWLRQLRGANVKLIFSQSEATTQVELDKLNFPTVPTWTIDDHHPTRSAISAIDEFCEWFEDPSGELIAEVNEGFPVIAVQPSRHLFFARIPTVGSTSYEKDSGSRGIVFRTAKEKGGAQFVPKASTILSAIAYFGMKEDPTKPDWQTVLSNALGFSEIWTNMEGGRIGRGWIGNGVRLDVPLIDTKFEVKHDFGWSLAQLRYEQAFEGWPTGKPAYPGYGLIPLDGSYNLELWRAMADVKERITITRPKREMVANLSKELKQFKRGGRSQNRSFLVVDDPGGGKTTIIRAMSDGIGFRFLSVNITELTSRHDLLGFFDTIVTTQAQDPLEPILVFVDEVNALLEGHSVYSAFLAPLEDGHYNREGKTFHIKPCVWIFAGTDNMGHQSKLTRPEDPNEKLAAEIVTEYGDEVIDLQSEDRIRRDRAQKKSDFISRLSMSPFILNRRFYGREEAIGQLQANVVRYTEGLVNCSSPDSNCLVRPTDLENDEVWKVLEGYILRHGKLLERVYIGCELIKRLCPHVDKVSLRVVTALAFMPDDITLRDIRHDLERMTNVQRGRVSWENMPARFRHRNGRKWKMIGSQWTIQVGTIESLTSTDDEPLDVFLKTRLNKIKPDSEPTS